MISGFKKAESCFSNMFIKVSEVSPFVRRNVNNNKTNINSILLSLYTFAMA